LNFTEDDFRQLVVTAETMPSVLGGSREQHEQEAGREWHLRRIASLKSLGFEVSNRTFCRKAAVCFLVIG
jgi:hypothetical protein